MLFPTLNVVYIYVTALKYVCSAKYGRFLQFVDFVFTWKFAQVFSELLFNGSSCPYYFWFIIITTTTNTTIIIINFLLIILATRVILSVSPKWLLGVTVSTCSSVLRPTHSRYRSSRY
jgi:hypothetical protein